jgi:pimeloyl-ACP methyl ester carboxylesterase
VSATRSALLRSRPGSGGLVRRASGAGFAGMLLLAPLAAAQAPPAREGHLVLTPYVLESSDGRIRTPAELGRLTVRENRRKPASRLIEIAFLRVKSTASRPGPPLIFLAGGPGGSGIDAARRPALLAFFSQFSSIGDVVFLDQRSTGLSTPRLDCPGAWDLPLDRPGSRAETQRIGLPKAQACRAEWTDLGVDVSGYNTEENADDVDAVRQALGADTMNLYGVSYGSHLGLSIIRRHGPRVHRAVLGMIEGPDHTFKLPSNEQRQMEKLHELVKADPELSRHVPDFLGLVGSVLERVGRKPVAAETTDPRTGKPVSIVIGKYDLQGITANGLGAVDFLQRLPARYYAMSQGDFSWAAEQALLRRRMPLGNAMTFLMDCASGATAGRHARLRQEAPDTLLEDLIDFQPEFCEGWDVPDLGDDFRAPVRSDVPVLFFSGTIDGRTPASNADEVRASFSNHHHLIVEGMAHGHPALFTSEAAGAIAAHLRGERVTLGRTSLPFVFRPVAAKPSMF